jgi:hypothetical protein
MYQMGVWLGREWKICGNKYILYSDQIENLVKYKMSKLIVSFYIMILGLFHATLTTPIFMLSIKVKS